MFLNGESAGIKYKLVVPYLKLINEHSILESGTCKIPATLSLKCPVQSYLKGNNQLQNLLCTILRMYWNECAGSSGLIFIVRC
jgi:hypothetical protein